MAKQDKGEQPPGANGEQPRRLSALDRAIQQAIGEGLEVGRPDDPAKQKYPSLWQWLTLMEGGRDYVMQPATISIQLGPEGVLISVTHRDLKRSVGAACDYLDDAIATLEAVLSGPHPPVRAWGKDSQAQLRKRRPKS